MPISVLYTLNLYKSKKIKIFIYKVLFDKTVKGSLLFLPPIYR